MKVNGGGLGTRLISLYPTLWCLFLLLQNEGEEGKAEYRVWNPFRSKLAAAILGGVDKIHIKPGSKVLYLGAASGTTVSHVADIVGPVSALVCENVCYATPSPASSLLLLLVCSSYLLLQFISVSNSSPFTLSPLHPITTHSIPSHSITTSSHHHSPYHPV